MRKLICLTVFLISLTTFSQKYELGEVTKEELMQKKHPLDSTAVATILFQTGETIFDFNQTDGFKIVTVVETKIKIYKKEGLDWANFKIRLYDNGSSREKVIFSKCNTYNLENDKVTKTKLKNDGIFEERLSKYYIENKLVFPEVKVGSIIEFSYKVESPFISSFRDWEFQKEIPVDYSIYTVKTPEYFTYNTHIKGWLKPELDKKWETITYSGKMSNVSDGRGNYTHHDYEFSCNQEVKKYFLKDILALKDEEFIDNIDNYKSTLSHELISTDYPNQATKFYAMNWEDVVKNIYKNEDFGGQLDKNDFYKNDLISFYSGSLSLEEKIFQVFDFVKKKMNWNEYYGYYSEYGIKKAYKENVGNVADINLLLVSILKNLGIDANPVLVSTKKNGISLFPSREAFNYVICGVEIDNKIILLDATDKNSEPNILPVRCLNWFGRLVRSDGTSKVVDLIPQNKSVKNLTMMYEINDDGEVKGKIREQYYDYYSYLFNNQKGSLVKDKKIELKEKNNNNSEIENYETKLSNRNLIIETYEFSNSDLVENISGKLYLKPLLFFQIESSPFKSEKREYPIDFKFPYQNKYSINVKIPEGYEVESYPESLNLAMENNLGIYSFNIKVTGDAIQIISTEDINQAILPSQHYKMLKSFYGSLVAKQNEKIVLKRKI